MSASKKELSSYSRRLRDNIKSILDNYFEILKASKAGLRSKITQKLPYTYKILIL